MSNDNLLRPSKPFIYLSTPVSMKKGDIIKLV